MSRIDDLSKSVKIFLQNVEIVISKVFGHWGELFFYIIKVPFLVIKNPKFVFPFLIIMLISSSGVWAPWAFEIDLPDYHRVSANLSNRPGIGAV